MKFKIYYEKYNKHFGSETVETDCFVDAYKIAEEHLTKMSEYISLSKIIEIETKNHTEIFGEGYGAGYNQALVEKGYMSQKEADEIRRR